MAKDQAQLVAALKQARTTPMSFAFVAKGNEGRLLLDKKKVPPKDAADTKKELGGGNIFKGRCLTEDGVLVFEVPKEPPGNLAALLKKIIKSDASLTLNVVVRVNSTLEEGEHGEGEHSQGAVPTPALPPPPAPPPQGQHPSDTDLATAVMKRLNAMTADIKTAMAGPNKTAVQTRFVAVSGLIKSHDYLQANKILDELEGLIKGPRPGGEGQSTKTDGLPVVKLGKARLEWNRIRASAVDEIQRLGSILVDEYKNEPDEQSNLAAAFERLRSIVATVNDDLSEQLDEVCYGDPAQRPQWTGKAKTTLKRLTDFLEADPVMSVIDGNEYAPDMEIAAPMRSKLAEIAALLG
jgi:hypothetical protein